MVSNLGFLCRNQMRIQNPVKTRHLRWLFKTLHLRCLKGFWICPWKCRKGSPLIQRNPLNNIWDVSTVIQWFIKRKLFFSHYFSRTLLCHWDDCFQECLWMTTQKSRSSCPEVFCKKVVLWNLAKFRGKHLCQSLFSCNFIKKGTSSQLFFCKFCDIFKNTFSYRTRMTVLDKQKKQIKGTLTQIWKSANILVFI